MALTEEEQKLVAAHLKKYWGESVCPMCQHKGWILAGHVAFELSDTPFGLSGTGRGLPCVAVICRRCGNTVLVNTRVATGAVKPE